VFPAPVWAWVRVPELVLVLARVFPQPVLVWVAARMSVVVVAAVSSSRVFSGLASLLLLC
jgi:hypothetical protein